MDTSNFCHNCFSELVTDNICDNCGYDNNKEEKFTSALNPGVILNSKYKVGKVLGKGGFGMTYKAVDIHTKTVVAIKEYLPLEIAYRDMDGCGVGIKAAKFTDAFSEGLLSFIAEANFLVLLKKNKNIVEIFDCFNENETAYFSMEFIDGCTYKEIPKSDFTVAYDAMLKVAEGLKAVHSKGIVHRDISPTNIFLLKNGDVKIIDFGNARYFDKSNRNDDKLILKPGFAPPELYMKTNVQGPWTDIYSLAATFYRVVTGEKLPSALERINGVPIIPIRRFIPNIQYSLEQALNRALDPDYVKRQRSIDEFLEEIEGKNLNYSAPTEYYDTPSEQNTYAKSSNVYGSADNYNRYNDNIKEKKSSEKAKSKSSFRLFGQGKENRAGAKDIGHKRENAAASGSFTAKRNMPSSENPAPQKNNTVKRGYVKAYDGRLYPVSDIKCIVIGRNASTSHIVINDVNVSRKHCVVEYNSVTCEFYVTDWSSNGSFMANNKRMEYGVKYKLKPGQRFYLYSSQYVFEVVVKDA